MFQTLAHITQIAGELALIVAAGTYFIQRNQLSFAVIANCNQRFQDLLVDLHDDGDTGQHAKRRYVDLCNEQLFYFRNGHLPREVFEEWLESIVDYLPLFDNVTGEVHPDHPGVIDPELLEGYPTIKRVFVVDGPCDLTLQDQRLNFVYRLARKIRPEPILRVIWRNIRDRLSDLNLGRRMDAHATNDKG